MYHLHGQIGVLSKPTGRTRSFFSCIFRISCLILFPVIIKAQTKVNYDVFNKSPLGGIKIENSIIANLETITNTNYLIQSFSNPNNNRVFTAYDQDRAAANLEYRQAQINADVQRDLNNFGKGETADMDWVLKTQSYRIAFEKLLRMNPNNFSITKALFIVESAYDEKSKLTYEQFMQSIYKGATIVKQLLKREGLSGNDNLTLNYGIQKLFKQTNSYYNSRTKQTYSVAPIKYDFEDYRGEKDYSKMFVTKLVKTGSGQCHSMPLLYLALAEALNAKAWLSLAPQHSFIQFMDNQNNLMNFETTNGNVVSSTWLTQSGYVNAMALNNKTYLDTLSQKNLYGQMMSDLLLGYMNKYGYDKFAEQMRQQILAINPNNLTAKVIDANIKTQIAMKKIQALGKPKEEDLPKYPDAYKAYQAMQASYTAVENTGFQDMPKEAYQKWLKSMEKEKKSQKNKELQEKMRKEIEALKKIKITFQNNYRN